MSKSPKSIVDRDLIHELTALLDETGLTEIEIEQDGKRIRVARGTIVAAPSAVRVEVAPGAEGSGATPQAPADPAACIRCCLESLACRYRWVMERLEALRENDPAEYAKAKAKFEMDSERGARASGGARRAAHQQGVLRVGVDIVGHHGADLAAALAEYAETLL
jgi:hypothetical protein